MTCDVVAFDFPLWSLRYPELAASVPQMLAQQYFYEATLLCDNSPNSPIRNLGQRGMLLGMVTAHIAALNAPLNGQPSSPLVGRINTASQGSVSVGTQLDMPPGTAQYWAQTKYGLAFWTATAQYRTMHYVPGPAPRVNPFGGFRGF